MEFQKQNLYFGPLVLAALQCYHEDNEEKNTKFFENACFKEQSGSKNALGNVECV